MDLINSEFQTAYRAGAGSRLANTLLPPTANPNQMMTAAFFQAFNEANFRDSLHTVFKRLNSDSLHMRQNELTAWVDLYSSLWSFLSTIYATNLTVYDSKRRYDSWKTLTNVLIKGYIGGDLDSWTLPCLYVAGRWLRSFAIEADKDLLSKGKQTSIIASDSDDISATIPNNETLEDAARILNRMFTLCISDRAPLAESRKWGLYYITNLLFKTYFKLKSVSLCKNPWRALQATHVDMPPIRAFPKAHICTFKYYIGLMFFLEEDYSKAEESFEYALRLCLASSIRNRELILTYLIPCRLMTSRQIPTAGLLDRHPRLERLFNPIFKAIRSGNFHAFDCALQDSGDDLVRYRIFLTLERSRDLCIRNLFRKVFLAGGFEDSVSKDGTKETVRRSRIHLNEFLLAVKHSIGDSTIAVDQEEVECLLANLIYKNLLKGYVARERGVVVVSKGNAFPGTSV